MFSGEMEFDSARSVWSTAPRKGASLNGASLGEAILRRLEQMDPAKDLEIHYDTGERSCVADVRRLTVSSARSLAKLGVQKGDVVVFFCFTNPQVTPVLYACLVIGAVIHTAETKLVDDDSDYVLGSLNPSVILFEPRFAERVKATVQRIDLPKLKLLVEFGTAPDSVDDVFFQDASDVDSYEAPHLGDPDETLGALLLTSGSTGLPKAIRLSHSLLHFGVFTWWDTTPDSIIYIASPLRWISQVSAILQPVFLDCTRVSTGQEPSVQVCAQIIKDVQLTHFFGVAALFFGIIQHAGEQDPGCLQSLERALTGGEVLFPGLLAETKKVVSRCQIISAYGLSELAGVTASNARGNAKGLELVPGLSMKIVDGNMNAVGPNEAGQICLRAPCPFLGYYKNDEANKAFLPGGWMNTGDFGLVNTDNILVVYGRYKDMIYCEDKLIIPSSVEQVFNSHPLVTAASVVGVPHTNPDKGQMVAAFLKISEANRAGQSDDEIKAQLLKYGEQQLQEHEKPLGGVFILKEFPATTCGKNDKVALARMARELQNQHI